MLNERLDSGHVKLHVVIIPLVREEMLDALVQGVGDIIAGGVVITEKRRKLVDFSEPTSRVVSEVLVSGPNSPLINSIEDLSGKKIYVRSVSSYRDSLEALKESIEN